MPLNATPLYPNPNTTTIVGLAEYANEVTNNLFGYGMLITIFTIAFVGLLPHGDENAFASASFLTFLVSAFFAVINLIPPNTVAIPAIMLAFSIFLLVKNKP